MPHAQESPARHRCIGSHHAARPACPGEQGRGPPRDARPQALAQLRTLDRETFGKRLRSARKRFGWTLAEAAERSGISITTISRAERGQLALSYEKFSALGRALRMDMGALFAEAGGEAQDFQGPIVTRAGQGVTYRGLAFSYEFLATQATGKQMNPILGTVHARRSRGRRTTRGTRARSSSTCCRARWRCSSRPARS